MLAVLSMSKVGGLVMWKGWKLYMDNSNMGVLLALVCLVAAFLYTLATELFLASILLGLFFLASAALFEASAVSTSWLALLLAALGVVRAQLLQWVSLFPMRSRRVLLCLLGLLPVLLSYSSILVSLATLIPSSFLCSLFAGVLFAHAVALTSSLSFLFLSILHQYLLPSPCYFLPASSSLTAILQPQTATDKTSGPTKRQPS